MKLAIVADDNTGATDAAGMLTSKGASVLMVINSDQLKNLALLSQYEVIVVATRIRSIKPKEAYERTLKVINQLQKLKAEIIQLKYCSTFDSTKEGNIGQSLDAALEAIKFKSTIVCPSLPVNNRTTYMGYLFVNGVPLNESPLRNHPLNPMEDANLVRWLSYQTDKKTDLLSWYTINEGKKSIVNKRSELEKSGVKYIVVDALQQKDIDIVVSSFNDYSFYSGGSGVSEAIAKILFNDYPPLEFRDRINSSKNKVVVISGSESPTTERQKKHALANGFEEMLVHPIRILERSATASEIAELIASQYLANKNVILSFDRKNGGDVSSVDNYAASKGLGRVEVGNILGMFFGEVANILVNKYSIGRLVVAGGETSGAVCEKCKFDLLEIGTPIDPGVPFCFPSNFPNLLLVLKSGNFGRESLYLEVANMNGNSPILTEYKPQCSVKD